jgi:phospholipase C
VICVGRDVFLRTALLGTLTVAAACNGSNATPSPAAPAAANPIHHIVIMVQENRSFNNLFAGFPGADTAMEGPCKPHPPPPRWWCRKTHEVRLRSVPLESTGVPLSGSDIDHSHRGFETECDPNGKHVCRMDGFDLINYGESGNLGPAHTYPYAYVERSETKSYWDFASEFTLADEMFFTETASSFISHQMLISGTVRLTDRSWVTDQPYDAPWGCRISPPKDWAPILYEDGRESHPNPSNPGSGVFPCFKWATIADLLDAKGVSWLDYVDAPGPSTPFDFSGGVWDGFAAIHKIAYGPDWKKNISIPNTNIFGDLKAGTLPSVSWVIPSLYDSDHPVAGCNGGPQWVTKVVDAVGTSRYWKDTAVILIWDDWGGWYDPVPPKFVNYSALGFRVPMIVIAPYAKPHYVSHSNYDFGSILKFTEETFGLGSLGTTDASAPPMDDVFDFTQAPLQFKREPIPPAMKCARKLTNPKENQELIDRDGGVPD